MKWTKITKSPVDGRVLMKSKTLLKLGQRCIDLHVIIDSDDPGVYHNHPADAIRIILWGSYIEQFGPYVPSQRWHTGMFGLVKGHEYHRISNVGKFCVTLWIRGKDQYKVNRITHAKKIHILRFLARRQ